MEKTNTRHLILAICSASENNSLVLYSPQKLAQEISWQSYQTQSREILPKIDKLFKKNQLKLRQLSAIAVWQGPGSYTGLRVGISIANTLAWSLDIPVIGVQYPISNIQFPNKFPIPNSKIQIQLTALEIAKEAWRIWQKKKLKHFTKIIEPIY